MVSAVGQAERQRAIALWVILLGAVSCSQAQSPDSTGTPVVRTKSELGVLNVLPDYTRAALVVSRLDRLDTGLGPILRKLGMVSVPSEFLAESLEIVAGLDDSRGAALAIVNDALGDANGPPPLVLVLPTEDREALLTFLQPRRLETGFWRVQLRGRESYAATVNDYTVFGPTLAIVQRVASASGRLADRLTVDQRASFSSGELSVWMSRGSGTRLWHLFPNQGDQSLWLDLALQILGANADAFVTLTSEPTHLVLQGHLSGLPEKEAITNGSASNGALLIGLPSEPIAIAFGAIGDKTGQRSRRLASAFMSIAQEWGGLAPTDLTVLTNLLASMGGQVKWISGSIALDSERDHGQVAATLIIRAHNDGRQLLASVRRLVILLKQALWVDPQLQRVMGEIVFRPQAQDGDPEPIDHVVINLAGFSRVDREVAKRAFGQMDLLIRIGLADRQTVVLSFGGNAARFGEVVSNVRANRAPLNDAVSSSKENPPEFGIPLAHLVGSIRRWASLAGLMDVMLGGDSDDQAVGGTDETWSLTVHSLSRRELRVDLRVPFLTARSWLGGNESEP